MPKLLVVAPSWVGDTLLAQPLFARLHERLENLQLDVLAPEWTRALLTHMPEVDQVWINPFGHGELNLGGRKAFAQRLKAENYDQAIVLPNSIKSALIPWYAGIPLRTGYLGEQRWLLLNDWRRLKKKKLPLMVERFAALAEHPGCEPARPLPAPRLHVEEEHRLGTLDKLALPLDKPLAVFCPGAEYGPAKRWPAQYFAELAWRVKENGYQVVLLGSPKDADIGEQIKGLSGHACENLCGRTGLSEAIDIIASAALVVSNDSGLMHVAAALDRPMIALYGSSSPGFTPPLSDKAKVVKLDIQCSPCFKRECPLKHFRCMLELTPQKVMGEIGSKD
jgi:heptosyltransferase-2